MRLLFTKTVFLLVCLFSLSTSRCQNADIDLLRNINLNRNKNLDGAFQFLSKTTSYFSISTPVVVLSAGFIKKDSALKKKGLYIAEAMLGSAIIATTLKFTINRPRPFTVDTSIQKLTDAGSKSFPSGHTSDAFVTATSLSIAFPKWYVITPAYLWASAVAYSRMDLGVHYPTDIVAGAIIGSGSAVLCYEINKWIRNKKRKKKVNADSPASINSEETH
jgi:membrane-associated phospholipid phosphatase